VPGAVYVLLEDANLGLNLCEDIMWCNWVHVWPSFIYRYNHSRYL